MTCNLCFNPCRDEGRVEGDVDPLAGEQGEEESADESEGGAGESTDPVAEVAAADAVALGGITTGDRQGLIGGTGCSDWRL